VTSGKERYSLPCKKPAHGVDASRWPNVPGDSARRRGGDRCGTGKPRFQLDQGAGSSVYFALYSADGRWILTSDNHARVLVWHARTVPRGNDSKCLCLQRFGLRAALRLDGHATGWSRRANLLRVRLGEPTHQEAEPVGRTPRSARRRRLISSRGRPRPSCWRRFFGGERACTAPKETSPSAEVRMRARGLHEQIINSRFEELPRMPGHPEGLAFSPDGKLMASAVQMARLICGTWNSRKKSRQLQPK